MHSLISGSTKYIKNEYIWQICGCESIIYVCVQYVQEQESDIHIFTSLAKEVMFLAALVCLFVCLFVCLWTTLLKKL